MRHQLNLQLFAEEKKDPNDEEENLDDEDFEEDFEENEDAHNQSKKNQKTSQSDEENARQAEIRRQKEQKEKEERIRNEAYEKGKKEAELNSNKTNPFTNSAIEDEFDLKIYRLQEKIKNSGGDPINDLPKELAKLEREKANQLKIEQEKKNQDEAKVQADIEEFKKTYSNVDLKKLTENSSFKKFAEGKWGNISLVKIYDSYMTFKKELGIEDEDEKFDKQARSKSASFSSSNKNKTSKSIMDMSDEEYLQLERKQSDDYF